MLIANTPVQTDDFLDYWNLVKILIYKRLLTWRGWGIILNLVWEGITSGFIGNCRELIMLLFVFECSKCKNDRRHIHPTLVEVGSYKDHCIFCAGVTTFNYVREEKMTQDWFTNVQIPSVIKRDEDLLPGTKRKGEKERIAS